VGKRAEKEEEEEAAAAKSSMMFFSRSIRSRLLMAEAVKAEDDKAEAVADRGRS
jgi:hypothetical protein